MIWLAEFRLDSNISISKSRIMRIWGIYLLSFSSLLATEPRISNVGLTTFSFGAWQAADVDGDGDLDIISTPIPRVQGSEQLTWFENFGDGSFSFNKHLGYVRNFPTHSTSVLSSDSHDYFPADSNRDGILEFLTFQWNSSAFELYLLDPLGTGNQTHLENYPDAHFSNPYLADLNEDNHPFIIDFHEDTKITFQISEITPNRSVIPLSAKVYSLPESFSSAKPKSVQAADLDLDGDRDLLISYDDGDRTLIFERISPTEFSEHATHEISDYYEHFADIDQDGDIDFYDDSTWAENTGNFSSLTIHTTIPHSEGIIRTPWGLRLFDRDDLDFVEYELQADGSWLETFRQVIPTLPSFDLELDRGSSSIEIADFDGDGYDEVCLIRNNSRTPATFGAYHLTTFTRTENGYREDASSAPPIPIDYSEPVVADFDNDGDMDVLVGPSHAGQYFLQLNDGRGNFTSAPDPYDFYPENLDRREFLITSLKAVYFDDDQHLDLAITFEKEINIIQVESACTIIKGSGHMTFDTTILPEGSFSFIQKGFCEITDFVDWDGDGDLDAILEGGWRENVDGELSPLFRSLLLNASTSDALGNPITIRGHQIADIDNDGAPDYIASAYTVGLRYYRFHWLGIRTYFSLSEVLELGIPFDQLQSEQISQMAIGFNKGDGTIEEVSLVDISLFTHDALGNPVLFSAGVLDLNGDGTLEFVTPVPSTDALGNPLITSYDTWATPPGEPRNFMNATKLLISLPFLPDCNELKDFDGDGTLEYVSAEQFIRPSPQGPQISPRYSFTGNVAITHRASRPTAVAIADFDGDGDLDHLLPDGHSRLNLVRNLIIDERSPITRELLSKGFIGVEANPDSDCDGDGFSNAYEYLFGTNPTVNQVEEPADLAPYWATHAGTPELRFLRRRDAAQLKLDYILERSLDLRTWEEVPLLDAESIAVDETWEWVTTRGLNEGGAYFFRTHPQHRP